MLGSAEAGAFFEQCWNKDKAIREATVLSGLSEPNILWSVAADDLLKKRFTKV